MRTALLAAFVGTLALASGRTTASGQSEIRAFAPVVVDVAGDGLQFSSVQEGVMFDVDGSGTTRRVAWTVPGTDDAFLALDFGRDGTIDEPGDLFGGMAGPPNGFEFLATLDGKQSPVSELEVGPRDGVMDVEDPVFQKLVLWADRNHNGKAEEDELESVAHAGFTRMYLRCEKIGQPIEGGNVIESRSIALRQNDRGVEVAREMVTVRLAQ